MHAFDPQRESALIAQALLKRSVTLILGRGELEIIRGTCQAIVDITPHVRLAWTWFGPSDTLPVAPQVFAGLAAAYAQALNVHRNPLTQRGPAFATLQGKTVGPFSISRCSLYGPWREAAATHGIRHGLALSITSTFNGYSGIFVLYADLDGYFDAVGTSLFFGLSELLGSFMTVAAERQELEQTAYHDALTGMLNRHAVALVDRRVYRSSLFETTSSILLLDLDLFKSINDRQGHDVGDQALQAVARVAEKLRGAKAAGRNQVCVLQCSEHSYFSKMIAACALCISARACFYAYFFIERVICLLSERMAPWRERCRCGPGRGPIGGAVSFRACRQRLFPARNPRPA